MESEIALLRLIGQRITERRASLRLSLDALAARSDVSRAMISRIERGEVHASAVVLDRLCAGLGITLSALFAREIGAPLARRADQPVWEDPASGYVRREVTPASTGSAVRIAEVEFPAGAAVTFARQQGRVLDQQVWVLKGEIEVETGGHTLTLLAGDCLHMNGAEGNGFRNRTDQSARYAVIQKREGMP